MVRKLAEEQKGLKHLELRFAAGGYRLAYRVRREIEVNGVT